MWLDDLAPFGSSDTVVAVGWLERGHPFPVGDVPLEVYEKLTALFVDPWQPVATAGTHACGICLYAPEKSGSVNLFVPGAGRLYVTPELVLHYMNAHAYRPPQEFCDAVGACPPTRSPEYKRALLVAGGAAFLRYAGVLP